jgi:hypothetical protein
MQTAPSYVWEMRQVSKPLASDRVTWRGLSPLFPWESHLFLSRAQKAAGYSALHGCGLAPTANNLQGHPWLEATL